MASKTEFPPIVVVFGDEAHQKRTTLKRVLDNLLPPDVDRAMALSTYDATQSEEEGGPTFAAVADDLATLSLMADRRVVLVTEADRFISRYRAKLEQYLSKPASSGTLVLECRTFPRNTNLYKLATGPARGEVHECKRLGGGALVKFVEEEARAHGKRIATDVARRLCDLIGQDQGLLAGEVEKLCLYAGDRTTITSEDISLLVGQTREEKIFKAMDAAALGHLDEALYVWHDTLTTDPAAVFKATGGMAAAARRWLKARTQMDGGTPPQALVRQMFMFGRDHEEIADMLRRFTRRRLEGLLAAIADLDTQAKSGTRSIERGVEEVLVRLAAVR